MRGHARRRPRGRPRRPRPAPRRYPRRYRLPRRCDRDGRDGASCAPRTSSARRLRSVSGASTCSGSATGAATALVGLDAVGGLGDLLRGTRARLCAPTPRAGRRRVRRLEQQGGRGEPGAGRRGARGGRRGSAVRSVRAGALAANSASTSNAGAAGAASSTTSARPRARTTGSGVATGRVLARRRRGALAGGASGAAPSVALGAARPRRLRGRRGGGRPARPARPRRRPRRRSPGRPCGSRGGTSSRAQQARRARPRPRRRLDSGCRRRRRGGLGRRQRRDRLGGDVVAGRGGHTGRTAATRGRRRCLTLDARRCGGGGGFVGHAKCSWVPSIATHTSGGTRQVGRRTRSARRRKSRRSWLLHRVGAIACEAWPASRSGTSDWQGGGWRARQADAASSRVPRRCGRPGSRGQYRTATPRRVLLDEDAPSDRYRI